MNSLKINIPKPCDANWEQMTPQDKGRFCGLCQKTVVDFTAFSDGEIVQYFSKYSAQQTCGLFRGGQLDKPLQRPKNTTFSKTVFTLLMAGAGLVSSCDVSKKGEVMVTDTTTVVTETYIQELQKDTTLPQQDSSHVKEGNSHEKKDNSGKERYVKGRPVVKG